MLRNILFVILILSFAVARAAAQESASTPTPRPTNDPQRLGTLRESSSPAGYPQLGFPNAPVSVVVYAAFDDPASLEFNGASFAHLITRARNAEIFLTWVPLLAESIPNVRGATRAALCAGEQQQFFRFADRAFDWAAQYGQDAFTGERLIAAVGDLGINLGAWQECMISDRPDVVIQVAETQRQNEQNFSGMPYVTVNQLAALTDPQSLEFTINLALQQVMDRFEQALAELTPTALPEGTPDPETTPEPETVVISPLMGAQVPPPIEIDLPEGWRYGYDVLVLQDIDAIRNIPLAVYTGPVTGGVGTIVLLWGFPNLVVGSPVATAVEPDLWLDGTRLLRLAIVEEGCNIGTDLRTEYNVGGLSAIGTQFAAVSCPELPDTRGWFAGLRQFNLNFMFYVFAEPIEAVDAAETELRAILESIRFVVPEAEPDAEATAAP